MRGGAVGDRAVRTLVEMIGVGDFPPNSRLPAQRALAEQLRISRASLREATLVLEALGYVRVEPNRGTFVCGHHERQKRTRWRFADRYSERDIFETRYTLESYTARLAALRASDEDVAKLRSCIEAMKQAARERDLVSFPELDFAFHHHIVRLSGNQVVAQTLRVLKEAMKESQRLPLADIARLWDPIHEHERILEAIRQHDPDGAAYLMQLHITRAAHRAKISLRI
jgi:GntR family transcriptional regulator, transcriptional repressor for pyruvate dehydrogenase complex